MTATTVAAAAMTAATQVRACVAVGAGCPSRPRGGPASWPGQPRNDLVGYLVCVEYVTATGCWRLVRA